MSHFDEAYSAVQAALDAGARYADARVMVQRTESMTEVAPARRRCSVVWASSTMSGSLVAAAVTTAKTSPALTMMRRTAAA